MNTIVYLNEFIDVVTGVLFTLSLEIEDTPQKEN